MLKTRQDWSLDARLSQAELKVKESPETILILSSNSNWENNSQRSSVGVIITVSVQDWVFGCVGWSDWDIIKSGWSDCDGVGPMTGL